MNTDISHPLKMDASHPQHELTDNLITHYRLVANEFREDLSKEHLAMIAMGILRVAEDLLDAREYLRLIQETSKIMKKGPI